MKRYIATLAGIFLIAIAGFFIKIYSIKNLLLVYYQNIQLLDCDKEIKTDSKHKDGIYNLLYYMSADRIIATRATWLGKISSDQIEEKNFKYKILRESSEKYINYRRNGE